jgi:hypothetical protein
VLVPAVVLVDWPAVPILFQLWLNICQGTGMSLPVKLLPVALLGVPITLDLLEGTVSRPDVEVSLAPPEVVNERMANWMRPVFGSTVKSRMYPRFLPSADWTGAFIRLLSRVLFPEWPH